MTEEYLDVIDAEGKVTGEKIRRADASESTSNLRFVQVWIFNSNGELLVGQRARTKDVRPNLLDSACAGHVSSGESYEKCAARELKEELGLEVPLEPLFEIVGPNGRAMIFTGGHDAVPAFDPREMNIIEFRSLGSLFRLIDEFPYLMSPGFVIALKEFQKRNGGM